MKVEKIPPPSTTSRPEISQGAEPGARKSEKHLLLASPESSCMWQQRTLSEPVHAQAEGRAAATTTHFRKKKAGYWLSGNAEFELRRRETPTGTAMQHRREGRGASGSQVSPGASSGLPWAPVGGASLPAGPPFPRGPGRRRRPGDILGSFSRNDYVSRCGGKSSR